MTIVTMKDEDGNVIEGTQVKVVSSEPSQDDEPDWMEVALSFLDKIDEAECSLDAWNMICAAKDVLK